MNAPAGFRGIWRSDAVARAVYSEAAGIQRIAPRAVAVPADTDDVATLVKWAATERVPLTPRGSASSMAGGAVGDGVVVDLSRLPAITPEIRRDTMRVSASAICAEVDAAARRAGLRFPVDPSSARFCTIGGMVSTNAAGARTLRFGPMAAWVEGVECVLSDGSVVRLDRSAPAPTSPVLARVAALHTGVAAAERETPTQHAGVRKESSGYALGPWSRSGNPLDLIVGSEGTLAIVTHVTLRLNALPATSATMLAAFPSVDAAAAAAAVAAELNAAACELLDRTFLEIARRGGSIPVPEGAEAVLLVDLEEPTSARLDEMSAALSDGFERAGAIHVEVAMNAEHAAKLWRLRHAASPILAALSAVKTSVQVIEDGAVPPPRLADYVRGLRELLDRNGFEGVLFGHAGDGHVHANVLVDFAEPGWRERLLRVFDGGVDLLAKLGGTTAGEHGDGRLRAGALARSWPAATVQRFAQVKAAFDPGGIFNPGVKLPADGAAPLGGPVKYDPALEPLPPAARAALDRVQRDRAWNLFRLDLLADSGR